MMARIQNNPNTKDRKGQLCAPLLREGCKKYQIGTHYFASTLNCSSWVLTFGKIKILNIFFWTQKSPETNNIASPLGLNFKLPMRDTRRNFGNRRCCKHIGSWSRAGEHVNFSSPIIVHLPGTKTNELFQSNHCSPAQHKGKARGNLIRGQSQEGTFLEEELKDI